MTDAPELKPCPFCGGGARIYQDPSHSTAWFCGCEDWDCFGNMMWDETKTGATDKWNRRADLSSPLGAVVKPLVWVRSEHRQPDQIGYHAQAICGPYAIWTNKAQNSFIASSAGYFSMVTDTLDAAQAAAQADYETRILAALEPPTHAALLAAALRLPEVVAMREALAKLRDLMCENFEDDDGNSGCGQCQDDCTGCLAHATLAGLEAKP